MGLVAGEEFDVQGRVGRWSREGKDTDGCESFHCKICSGEGMGRAKR